MGVSAVLMMKDFNNIKEVVVFSGVCLVHTDSISRRLDMKAITLAVNLISFPSHSWYACL